MTRLATLLTLCAWLQLNPAYAQWTDLGFSSVEAPHSVPSYSPLNQWRTFSKDEQWRCGFIDKAGRVIVPAKYDQAKPFSMGKAPVALRGKWGFINKNGSISIDLKFDDAELFKDGLAPVRLGNKWGFIDERGNLSIDYRFLDAFSFSEGLALVKTTNDKWVYIDTNGKTVFALPMQFVPDNSHQYSCGFALVQIGEDTDGVQQYAFIDRSGKNQFKREFRADVCSFSEEKAVATPYIKSQLRRVGVIDRAGKFLIPPIFDLIGPFHEKLASVGLRIAGSKDTIFEGKWGFIDQTGKVVIPFRFEDVGDFHSGLAPALQNNRWGYIDVKGNWKIRPQFHGADIYSDSVALVNTSGKWSYYDLSGQRIIVAKADLCGRFHEGRALIAISKISNNNRQEMNPVSRHHLDSGCSE